MSEWWARFHEVGPPPDVEALLTSKDRGLRLAGVAAVYASPRVDAVAAILDAGVTPDKPFNEHWARRALGKEGSHRWIRCYLLALPAAPASDAGRSSAN